MTMTISTTAEDNKAAEPDSTRDDKIAKADSIVVDDDKKGDTATDTIPTSDRISSIKTIDETQALTQVQHQDPILPKGWLFKSIPRKCDDKHMDPYWYTPITHHRLRSKIEVLKFLALQNEYKSRANDEAYIIEIFKNQPETTDKLYTEYVKTNKDFVDLFRGSKHVRKRESTMDEPKPKKQRISTPRIKKTEPSKSALEMIAESKNSVDEESSTTPQTTIKKRVAAKAIKLPSISDNSLFLQNNGKSQTPLIAESKDS